MSIRNITEIVNKINGMIVANESELSIMEDRLATLNELVSEIQRKRGDIQELKAVLIKIGHGGP